MNLFFRVSGIAFILLLFLGTGVFIGKHEAPKEPVTVVETGRFQQLSATTALDTKSGKICMIVNLSVGATLEGGTPACSELASR